MSSTHISLHFHLVFSTKDRVPSIDSKWREDLHAYLGGIVRSMDGVPEAVGGVADHVHLLVGLRSTHRLADVLREMKTVSSRWIRDEKRAPAFAWQDGYGAFTVSSSQRNRVRDYIANQAKHHRRRSFQEEYRDLLDRSGVEYDERYLW